MRLKNHATLARLDQLLSLQPSEAHRKEIESMISEQTAHLGEYPTDISTQAVLAALCSATSDAPTQSPLPPVSSFTAGINVAALEAQGIPPAASHLTITEKTKSVIRPRKRRVRGGKVFDASQQVDPERWLPLRERSYYKPSKSKRKKPGGAAQGSAVEAESMGLIGNSHQAEGKKADPGAKKKKKGRK